MPHIIIKTINGPSKQQLQEAADQISKIVTKTMGKPEKYISVSVEEYSFAEWEGVYNEYVKGKDNVLHDKRMNKFMGGSLRTYAA